MSFEAPRNLSSVYVITGLHGQDGAYLIDAILDEMEENFAWETQESVTFLCPVRNLRRSPGSAKAEARVGQERSLGREVNLDIFICDLAGDCQELRKRLLDPEVMGARGQVHLYAMAALSHVGESWKDPSWVLTQNLRITTNLLEVAVAFDEERAKFDAMDGSKREPIRVFFAGTSELFSGKDIYPFMNEEVHFRPKSPYAVSKLAGVELCRVYKEAYGLDVRVGILFNHESPLRGDNFFTKRVVNEMARMEQEVLEQRLPEPMTVGQLIGARNWSRASTLMRGVVRLMNHPSDKVETYFRGVPGECDASEGVIFCSRKMTFLAEFIDRVLTRFPKLYAFALARAEAEELRRKFEDSSYEMKEVALFGPDQNEMKGIFLKSGPEAAERVRPRTLAERGGLVETEAGGVRKVYQRPSDVYYLHGDCSVAVLNGFLKEARGDNDEEELDELINEMVEALQ